MGLGQAVAYGTGPKRDADVPAPELLPPVLGLPFFDGAPPLFATSVGNVPDATRFY